MTFDWSTKGEVHVDMIDYMQSMVQEFKESHDLGVADTPAPNDLFDRGDEKNKLSRKDADLYHRMVAKALFACKRARPDIHLAVAILCTRTTNPNQDDWRKLVQLLEYCNGTLNDKLILGADDLHIVKWPGRIFCCPS